MEIQSIKQHRKNAKEIMNDKESHLRYKIGHTIAKNLPLNIPWIASDIAQILSNIEVKKNIQQWVEYNMKLSDFKNTLKQNLPKWEIEIDNESSIRFTLKDKWSRENSITFWDLNYIKNTFHLNTVIVKNNANKWSQNNVGITSTIQIEHNMKFEIEKEEWEE